MPARAGCSILVREDKMKKIVFAVFVIAAAANGFAQEMQISGGAEAAFGVFKVNNDFWYSWRDSPLPGRDVVSKSTNSVYTAPGISFTVRAFPGADGAVSKGFVSRTSAVFMRSVKEKGTLAVNGDERQVSGDYTISGDVLASVMNFGLGSSYRFRISDRFSFYTDLGLHLTVMDWEFYDTKEKLNYLGIGIFSDIAFQFSFTKRLYLELGLNSIINIFSSQKGEYAGRNGVMADYEDSGRWDLASVAGYLHIGWRVDTQNLRK